MSAVSHGGHEGSHMGHGFEQSALACQCAVARFAKHTELSQLSEGCIARHLAHMRMNRVRGSLCDVEKYSRTKLQKMNAACAGTGERCDTCVRVRVCAATVGPKVLA